MSYRRANGVSYNMTSNGGINGYRASVPSPWGAQGSGGARYLESSPGNSGADTQTPQWDLEETRDTLYLDEREGYADQLGDYGNQMMDLFDLYKPQYEYIADNAGVSGSELGQRLADSGASYNANYDAMTAEAGRDLKRMGVNPNSGRYAALTTGNALSKAAGFSMNQNQVRQHARQEDMSERFQAAQLGLNVGGQGANSFNAAGSTYGQMGGQLQSSKQFYEQMEESSRQFDENNKLQKKQLQLSEQNQKFNQAQQRYMYGLQVSYEKDPRGNVTNQSYGYGF